MTQRSCTTRWALMVISRLASTSLISLTGIANFVPLARNSRDGFQCQGFALFWQLVTTFDMLLTMGNLDAEAQVAVNPEADRPVLDSSRLLFGHPWLAWKVRFSRSLCLTSHQPGLQNMLLSKACAGSQWSPVYRAAA